MPSPVSSAGSVRSLDTVGGSHTGATSTATITGPSKPITTNNDTHVQKPDLGRARPRPLKIWETGPSFQTEPSSMDIVSIASPTCPRAAKSDF